MGGMVLMGLGMSPVFTLGNDIVISSAPPERAGAASALSETSSELSGALGIAVFGSLATSLYRSGMRELAPADLPVDAALAASTLGGAFNAANHLPQPMAQALRHAASAAFVDSLQAAALLGMAITTVSALLAWRLLRERPPASAGTRAG